MPTAPIPRPKLLALLAARPGALHASAAPATQRSLKSKPDDRLSTIPHDAELAKAFADSDVDLVAVRHEGWDETVRTWARVELDRLTGRTSIHGQDPTYTILSMMYEPERWMDAKFIPVEHPDLLEKLDLDGKWVSPREVGASAGRQALQRELMEMDARKEELAALKKLHSYVSQVVKLGVDREGVYDSVVPPGADVDEVRRLATDPDAYDESAAKRRELAETVAKEKPLREAGMRLLDRAVALFSLPEDFLVVPDPKSLDGDWMAARDAEPSPAVARTVPTSLGGAAEVAAGALDLPGAAGEFHRSLAAAFAGTGGQDVRRAVGDFLGTVERSRHYPDRAHRLKMNLYTNLNPMRKAAWIYGAATVLFGVFAFFRTDKWRIAGTIALCAGLALQTFGVVMRLVITERMPVSNMYESITFASWCALALGSAIELRQRRGVAGLAAAIVGFLMLTGVGLMPLHDARIHALRAVLNSYWLNIHVTAMLASYGTFAVAAVFAAGYLVKAGFAARFGRETLRANAVPGMAREQMEEFAYRLVQVGWPILTVGVCLGAVWADTAWGRYWGWDPKETWALITWIVYTIYLHLRMVMGWRGTISAVACLTGFLMVIITWLGVSYVPWFAGGLHTYASPT